MSSQYDVLLLGGYFCDLIFTGLPELPRLGTEVFGTGFELMPGGSFINALALHRLGLRVGWPCDFGTDLFSQFVLQVARQHQLDESLFVQHSHPVRHLSVSLSFPEDRAFLTYMDKCEPRPLAELAERYQPRSLLIPHLHYNTETLALINAVHRYGGIVLLDCQQTDKTLDSARLVELLRRVDIFLPNADEAMKLTHAATVSEAIKRLGDLTPTVVVKLGAEGALARQGAKTIHMPAISVKAVDTTGAGDCFSAGFLYGYLNGESLETCLRCGNICGGLSTTAYGGATAAPTVEQLTDWLERYE